MCGIAGIIDPKIENKEKTIGLMVEKIFHRGPDQDGFLVDEKVGLGMRRLSIIDISSGKQPIWSEDRTKCIFFNGEIYNYKELKSELEGKGRVFSTHSDTEVILQMYQEYGEVMLPRLRGMFAFCIYDTVHSSLFLARDFFGIKPLYYLLEKETGPTSSHSTQVGRVRAFSSEIKSFLEIDDFKTEVNDSAVYNYLSFQYNPLDETFFKGVWKLPPAHFMKVDLNSGQHQIQKYWQFEFKNNMPRVSLDIGSEEKMSKLTLDTMRDSVEHHMIADVPVGAFLSGGVDSSIIATLMNKVRNEQNGGVGEKRIKTFTVGFSSLTEGNESKETSDFLGTDHTEITVSPQEYFNILPKAVWHFDEPVADPSAIGLYFVAREARKHVTVVLSGEGADELFGGYNIYLAPFAYRKISWIPRKILGAVLSIPFGFFGRNFIRRAYLHLEDWYIGNASIFGKSEIGKLWKGEKEKTFSLNSIYEKTAELSDSTKMQFVDIHTWLIGDILAKADKMTMANSLELRVPFLDIEVAKLAEKLPDNLKWKDGTTKYLLRKAFSGVIPETTRNRKKLGFPTPVRSWFTADRKDLYKKITDNQYIQEKMDLKIIEKVIEDHTSGRADNSRKIYLLLMLALWYDVFRDTRNEIRDTKNSNASSVTRTS